MGNFRDNSKQIRINEFGQFITDMNSINILKIPEVKESEINVTVNCEYNNIEEVLAKKKRKN